MSDVHIIPRSIAPEGAIFARQVHGADIIELAGDPGWTAATRPDADGLITTAENITIGIYTADCAGIAFVERDGSKVGVLHAGWRGLVSGIIERMTEKFTDPEIIVGPVLATFEIQRDDCWKRLRAKFGNRHFDVHPTDSEKLIFRFRDAIREVIPDATFDPRSTADDHSLASWRRDQIRGGPSNWILARR